MYFSQKKILKFLYSILFILFLVNLLSFKTYAMKSMHGLDGYIQNKIDARSNARLHSNMGNIYLEEKRYLSALKEYSIAYSIDSDGSMSGTYLYNISRCYFILEDYKQAKKIILDAINKDCMNLTFYEHLANCIVKLNTADIDIEKYINDTTNPYNRVIVGYIYLKTNRKAQAIATFDDFISENPDMIVSDDLRVIIKRIK